jgi:hypothetical protein
MLPFRLFSPDPAINTNEMVNNMVMGRWASEIGSIIDNRRRDKFSMHAIPFPVLYQEFGAEGKNLAPKELVDYQTTVMLDGMGYPRELFTGSLQYLQIPTALRLFENSWLFVHVGFNQLTQWVVRKVRNYLNLPRLRVELQRPSVAESLERKQFVFQLAAMGEISRETAYGMLGIDNVPGENKKRLEEDAEIERQRMRTQQELQKEMETGTLMAPQDPQGGEEGSLPGAPGPQGNTTPMDVSSDAEDLAMYWLQLPDGERRSAMQAVASTKPEMHAMAKEIMEKMRRQGESQGRQMVNQQAQQGGM